MDLLATPQAGRYRVIYCDPPWTFKNFTDEHNPRSPQAHYPTLSLEELKALPVRKVAARDCHLFLWTTWPHLPQALELMAAWGFKYSSEAFTWAKLRRNADPAGPWMLGDFPMKTGHTTRKSTEPCLQGRRGSARRLATDVRELVIAPVREHSRKPDCVREEIQRYSEGPYLEMFSRSSAPGWDAWGNETGKFDVHQLQSPPGSVSG